MHWCLHPSMKFALESTFRARLRSTAPLALHRQTSEKRRPSQSVKRRESQAMEKQEVRAPTERQRYLLRDEKTRVARHSGGGVRSRIPASTRMGLA
eukprot:4496302-Heterocapsa_arctica.AAC.1